MTEKIIELLKDKKGIEDVKLVYSYKEKILCVFTMEKIYVLENIIDNPNIRAEIKVNCNFDRLILHPKNENQLLALSRNSVFLISNLRKFSNMNQLKELNLEKNKEILSIKFSYFDNCFGVLYKDKKFIYYLIKENNALEEICFIKDLDNDYIDFNFCPIFSKGFEIFMVIFIEKYGTIYFYGPFFPNEFFIPKEYFFNMDNYLIYKLSITENNNKNNSENTLYCLSLNVIDDLKKSIIENKSDKNNYFIKISDKMKIFNSTFRKREIKIHNNFLTNNSSELFKNNYKQIHILNSKPLTILRISEKNDIDLIMIGEEIMPLELAQTGNFTFNFENSINNYFIEFIRLNNKKEKNRMEIFQYDNEELFAKTENSLFLIKIPYLNKLKTIAEENIRDLPNKMIKTKIIKLFKWKNNIDKEKEKIVELKDILIIANFKKLFIFGILKENLKAPKPTLTLKIKEKNLPNEDEKTDLSNFNNIINHSTEYDTQIKEIKSKLNENDFIKTSNIKKYKLEVDEDILKDEKINFEKLLNNQMNYIYKTYKNIIQTNEEVYNQKIDTMKNIYKNLSKSQIKLAIDETIKRINDLNNKKIKISDRKKVIEEKIDGVKKKIIDFKLDDDEIFRYLTILEDYQKKIEGELKVINENLDSFQKYIEKIYSFTNLFPKIDLGFDLIQEDNQTKYLEFEKRVIQSSKNISKDLTKIK